MMEQQIQRVCFPDRLQVTLENATIRPIKDRVFVNNRYSLISPGTELALYTGTHVGFGDPDIAWARYPIYPGYASVGTVKHTAAGCSLQEGDRVIHFSSHSSSSLIDPEQDLWFLLQDEHNEREALFARFAQIAATAVNVRHIEPKTVLVFGAGLIGNLCAQLYQLHGDVVILADLSEKRLDLARQCGVRRVINSGSEDVGQQLSALTNGQGVDLIVEATGVPALVPQALDLLNEYGELLLLGSTRGTVDLNVYKLIHRKKTMLTGVHESYFPLKSESGISHKSLVNQILEHLAAQQVIIAPLISHVITSQELKQAYDGLLHDKEHYLGVLIDWKKEA